MTLSTPRGRKPLFKSLFVGEMMMLIASEVATPLRACYRSRRNQFSLEGHQMQYGFSPPVSGPLSSPDNRARSASEGEASGSDYATISDHVVIARDSEARY